MFAPICREIFTLSFEIMVILDWTSPLRTSYRILTSKQGRTQRGGRGGSCPPRNFQSKNKQKNTQILDFLIVVSVNQNIMHLKQINQCIVHGHSPFYVERHGVPTPLFQSYNSRSLVGGWRQRAPSSPISNTSGGFCMALHNLTWCACMLFSLPFFKSSVACCSLA